MRKVPLVITLSVVFFGLCLSERVVGQERPRGGREKNEGGKRPPERVNKWDKGRLKPDFNRAAEGRRIDREGRPVPRVEKASKWKAEFTKATRGQTKEKKEAERRNRTGDVARRVDKTSKWGRSLGNLEPGQHTKRFNDAANPKSPPGGGGSKTGGGAAAPPSGPRP